MPDREAAIKKAIEQYARAYRRLELLQRKEKGLPDCLIPIGDQKTGSIGEFWALLCLRRLYPDAEVTLSGQHNAPFDIEVKKRGRKAIKIQVKTVGPYNENKVLSEIKRGHDELHVVELDETLRPARYNRVRRAVTGSGKKATSFEGREALDPRLWA